MMGPHHNTSLLEEDMLDDLERAKHYKAAGMMDPMMADGVIPGAPGGGMGYGGDMAARRRGILASTGAADSIYGGTKSMYNQNMYDGTKVSWILDELV